MAGVVWRQLRTTRLTPTEAEVILSVNLAADAPAGAELAGRVIGPSCRYAETIEIAYPLRPLPPAPGLPPTRMAARAVVPEPNWWAPETPFLYRVNCELRPGGGLTGMTHGFRAAALSPTGLRWNGRPLPLRGLACDVMPEPQVRGLVDDARRGHNLLLAPARFGSPFLWHEAERSGCLMLGRFDAGDDLDEQCVHAEAYLSEFACTFGWLFPAGTTAAECANARKWLTMSASYDPFLGLELDAAPAGPLPGAVDFVACRAELIPALAGLDVPKLILGPPTDAPGVIGHVG
jgi:hypothetical protein